MPVPIEERGETRMHPIHGVIAGVDVHKKVLYVVSAREGGWKKMRFGATSRELRQLAEWLAAEQVTTVVMESTALYWRRFGWRSKDGSASYWRKHARTLPCKDARQIMRMRPG